MFSILILLLCFTEAFSVRKYVPVGSRLKEEIEKEERNAICCAKKMKCCRQTGIEPNIEIRAVLVRCPNTKNDNGQSRNLKKLVDSNREENLKKFPGFDEDEPLLQSQVKSCNRKLIITMRIDNSGHISKKNQFVIIDHVFDPISDKSQRLLNPYVIKLKQDHVTQMYGMKFLNYVNSEAKEVVYNKHMSNYTGCKTDGSNPTCGIVTYNDKVIPYSEGFCCSCDSLTNIKRQPASTSSFKEPIVSYSDPAFLMDGVSCGRSDEDGLERHLKRDKIKKQDDNDKSVRKIATKKPVFESALRLSTEPSVLNKFTLKKQDNIEELKNNPRGTVGIKTDQLEKVDKDEESPKYVFLDSNSDKLNKKFKDLQDTEDILFKERVNFKTNRSKEILDFVTEKQEKRVDLQNTNRNIKQTFKIDDNVVDENDELSPNARNKEEEELVSIDQENLKAKKNVPKQQESVPEEIVLLDEENMKEIKNVPKEDDELYAEQTEKNVHFHDDPWNIRKRKNFDDEIVENKKNDAKTPERTKRETFQTLIGNKLNEDFETERFRNGIFDKRQISSGGSQIRGGQSCANRYTPPGVDQETYHESTHCLRFSEVWYGVYALDEPIVEHSLSIQIFEKHENEYGKTKWRDVTRGHIVHLGTLTPHFQDDCSTLSINYNSKYMKPQESRFAINYKTARLLLPEGIEKCDLNQYPELRNGPAEYLILHPDLISIDGDKCNVAGVGFEAFFKQPNRCGVQKGTCLANQPKCLWRHDHRAEKLGRKGCFFLKHYGILPENPIRKNGTDQIFLSLEYSGKYSTVIDMEINADSNAVLRPSSTALITEVYVDSTSQTKTILTIKVTNGGLISSTFLTKLNDCPLDLPPSFNNIESNPVLIPPQHQHVFTLELRGRLTSDIFHCSVEVMNMNYELVALRRVKIQKSDRCICTWHCLCACIGSPDGLKCKPMSVEQYHAAGFQGALPIATAVVYNTILDDILETLVYCIIFIVLTLLFLGITKAIIGLCCCPPIGMWGLNILLDLPKRMNKYYEKDLQSYEVEYDDSGWPVHPIDKNRVRNIGRTLEFCTNLLFFFTYPIIILMLLCKRLCCPYYTYEKEIYMQCPHKNSRASKQSINTNKSSSNYEIVEKDDRSDKELAEQTPSAAVSLDDSIAKQKSSGVSRESSKTDSKKGSLKSKESSKSNTSNEIDNPEIIEEEEENEQDEGNEENEENIDVEEQEPESIENPEEKET